MRPLLWKAVRLPPYSAYPPVPGNGIRHIIPEGGIPDGDPPPRKSSQRREADVRTGLAPGVYRAQDKDRPRGVARMRFKLTIEYAGTRYSGWQIQKNAKTIQGEIERAIRTSTAADFELAGAGRTDAGVHALRQVAHLDVSTTVPPETLRRRVNDELPSDISLLAVELVAHRFHARHSAVARSYLYQISRRRTAFAKPFVWWVKDDLDLPAMRSAAAQFVGFHDFRTFSDDDPTKKSTVVHVEALDIHEDGDLVLIHVEGSHFIWKMVRRVVGVLAEVGRGKLSEAEAARFLLERSPRPAQVTAPASGLFLERVYYPGDARNTPVQAAVVVPPAL